jgi:predicted histone-like DNA-binding protein
MSIHYSVSAKLNPRTPGSWPLYYANVKSSGSVSLKQLGKEITQRSTVNHADTLAVLESLTQLLGEHLAEGEIVGLGEFGSFSLSLRSTGAESAEKFSSSHIEKAKINFRPGEDLKGVLKTLTFKRV